MVKPYNFTPYDKMPCNPKKSCWHRDHVPCHRFLRWRAFPDDDKSPNVEHYEIKRAYLLSVATKNISTSRLHHASLPLLKVHWGYAELRRQKSWIAVTAMHYDRHKQMGLPTCLARDKACQSSQNDTGDDPIKKLNNQGLPKCKQQISFDFCCLHGHHHNNRCWLIGFFIGLRV